MAITLLKSPAKWQAAHLPVVYEFAHTIELDGSGFPVRAENYGGFVALANTDGALPTGLPIYLSVFNSVNLYQDQPARIVDQQLVWANDFHNYAVTDVPWNEAFTAGATYYTLDQIQALGPAFNLYVESLFIASVRVGKAPNGQLRVDLSSYLKSQFLRIVPPNVGANPSLVRNYRLEYGEKAVFTFDDIRYVLNSAVQPLNPNCADAEPRWEWDISTVKCQFNAPRTSANRVAKKIDTNLNSATFGTHYAGGAYLYFDNQPGECPIVNTAPDWQFDLSTLKCQQDVPRSTSNRIAQKKDMNANSPTAGQYQDGGAYFFYDNQPGECPLSETPPATVHVNMGVLTPDDYVKVGAEKYTYSATLPNVADGTPIEVFATANHYADVKVRRDGVLIHSYQDPYVFFTFFAEADKRYTISMSCYNQPPPTGPGGPVEQEIPLP